MKTAWAMQEDAFKSNLPLGEDKIRKVHTFDRRSMATVFPFINSDVGHENGIPIGFNRQTGLPILYDNFSPTLSNYNMVIFGKSGAGKGVTIKTLIARSAVLMGIESLALDAEGEYGVVADALGGLNVVISPSSNTIINPFDIEPEITRDEITGREKVVLNVENKVEDVTQILLTMARGSTRTEDVNEVTKQIIAEAAAEEYAALGITNDVNSLYERNINGIVQNNYLGRTKKKMPTIGSWYRRLVTNANQNTNPDYRVHYSYLVKVMKQYVRELNGQMAYFDGQSTFDLLDGTSFINLDISNLEERFARPLAQQILLSWIWEKYVKKNSEDKTKAGKKRVLVDEAWMLLPYPEAVDFLNKMARRARKRNVSLAVVSQRFQDFYEKSEVQAVLTSSDTKLFLAQDKSEIQYIKEVFKLSEGEASFLTTCSRGQGLFKVGEQTAIMEIVPTKKEFEFIETNINEKYLMMKSSIKCCMLAVVFLLCGAAVNVAYAQSKKFSVLGDSYSTFEGLISPSSNACWYFNGRTAGRSNDVKSVLSELEKQKISEDCGIVIGSFEAFIKVVTEVKKKFDIKSNTVAFSRMIDICKEYLKKAEEKGKEV